MFSMPARSRSSGKSKSALHRKRHEVVGDVTINDFANSANGLHTRTKKAMDNVFCKVKQVLINGEENDDDDNSSSLILGKDASSDTDKNRDMNNGKQEESKQDSGVDYPLDVWFLISEFIKPEDVGIFARICKKTYYVIQSAKFWFHLYKRYYTSVSGVPQYLQPQSMVHQCGLRAYVIRALHYTYFPLFRGTSSIFYTQQKDPHLLVNRQCVLMWHKNDEERCYFYFKLKEIPKKLSPMQQLGVKKNKSHSRESIQDVTYNPENNCKTLRVTSLKYNMVPPVIGLTLQSVAIQLSRGFSHHRLQLGFGTLYTPKAPSQVVVLLSEVVHIEILDWWQPRYPYQEIERTIHLPPTIDSWDQI